MESLTLKRAVDLFLEDRASFCSSSTIYNYNNTMRYFLDYIETVYNRQSSAINLKELQLSDIKQYEIYLRSKQLFDNHPLHPVKKGAKLSRRTVRNYCCDLKTFINFCVTEGYLPDRLFHIRLIKAEQKVIIPLTASEIDLIDNSVSLRNKLIIHLMLDAGLRLGEVVSLGSASVFLKSNRLVVTGKGSKQRIVPIGDKLHHLIEEWLADRPVPEQLLTNKDGQQLTAQAVKCVFARLKKRTGIQRLHPHLLRHTFATCFCYGGGNIEMLRIYMGHESILTTQHYMHVSMMYELTEDPYELDPIFFKKRKSQHYCD